MSMDEPASPGWEPLPDDLGIEFMHTFTRRFSFRPDFYPEGWPSITEPEPSVTLDLSATSAGPGIAIDEGDELIVGVLGTAFPGNTRLVAINFNHYACWFWPRRFAAAARVWPDSWRVHPFPNGDYSIFVTEDMTSGTFGHPWEQTLCVFGERLIEPARTLTRYWPVKRDRL